MPQVKSLILPLSGSCELPQCSDALFFLDTQTRTFDNLTQEKKNAASTLAPVARQASVGVRLSLGFSKELQRAHAAVIAVFSRLKNASNMRSRRRGISLACAAQRRFPTGLDTVGHTPPAPWDRCTDPKVGVRSASRLSLAEIAAFCRNRIG